MVDFGAIGTKAGEIGSVVLTWGLIILGGIIALGIIGCIAWLLMRRKRWNLIVEVKMPRTDGQVILREAAKGHWDVKAGIVDIKRKKLKAVGMKPFDVRKYLQGEKYLEVLQIGPTDYIPILPKGYQKLKVGVIVEGKETFNDFAIMDIEERHGRITWKGLLKIDLLYWDF